MSNLVDVAVLITCFNKEEYLDECVQSIIRQTKVPREIIVVHDGCENPMHHARATSIFLDSNYGVARARHEAFRYSTAPLILFVDADDVLSPDYLEKMILVLAKGKGADIVYPDTFIWNGAQSELVVTPNKIDLDFVREREKVVIPVTSLMKREVYLKLKGFKKMEVLEDFEFFVRALKDGFVFKKAQTLLWYRRIPGSRNTVDLVKRKAIVREVVNQIDTAKN